MLRIEVYKHYPGKRIEDYRIKGVGLTKAFEPFYAKQEFEKITGVDRLYHERIVCGPIFTKQWKGSKVAVIKQTEQKNN